MRKGKYFQHVMLEQLDIQTKKKKALKIILCNN